MTGKKRRTGGSNLPPTMETAMQAMKAMKPLIDSVEAAKPLIDWMQMLQPILDAQEQLLRARAAREAKDQTAFLEAVKWRIHLETQTKGHLALVETARRLQEQLQERVQKWLSQPEVQQGLTLVSEAIAAAEKPEEEGARAALNLARQVIPDFLPAEPDEELGSRLWQALNKRLEALRHFPMTEMPQASDYLADLFKAALARAPLPVSPNPFSRTLARFASGSPTFWAVQAILKAKTGRDWETDEYGRPRFAVVRKGETYSYAYTYHIILPLDPAAPEIVELAQKELAYEILRSMGPDTAWLHMLLLAYAAQTKPGEKAVIPREAVYKALGLDGRSDLTRREKDKRCWEEISRLQSLGISILQFEITDRTGKKLKCFYDQKTGALWHLVRREFGQLVMDVDENGNLITRYEDWQLIAAPGAWAHLTLYGEPLEQIGYLARDMFEKIDRRRSEWAAALAMMLCFYGRFNPQACVTVTAKEIIEFAGGDPYPTDFRQRYDTAQRVLNAIEEQTKWGWQVDYSDCPEWMRPGGDADKADAMVTGDGSEAAPGRRPRHYWDAFLQAKIRFEPPRKLQQMNMKAAGLLSLPVSVLLPSPKDKPKSAAKSKARRPAAPAKTQAQAQSKKRTFTASDLRELRTSLGMTQRELAEYLGVSCALVSYMEKGTRPISTRIQKRLAALVENQKPDTQ